MKPKYKVGDRLRCIKNLPYSVNNSLGAGYNSGKEFTVNKVTESRKGENHVVYWPEKNIDFIEGYGIFGRAVEIAKVTNWKEHMERKK